MSTAYQPVLLEGDTHAPHCPCDECWAIRLPAIQGTVHLDRWKDPGFEWVRKLSARELNWTLEPGHCALCGGTDLNVFKQSEHWRVLGHNPKTIDGIAYLSILVHKEGSSQATYAAYTRKGKEALREWAARMLGINPQFACAIAVRELEDWNEIRLGFKYVS